MLNNQFLEDVHKALSTSPKAISSKYFYDEQGSKLFQAIMTMPEYYLTDCEYEIFETQGKDIISKAFPDAESFDLVELGAGDGLKTKLIIRELLSAGRKFNYRPIDISSSAIQGLASTLKSDFPELSVDGKVNEYFSALREMSAEANSRPRLVLFLGSNIGNFRKEEAVAFLKKLADSLNPGDQLLIGIDLKKDPHQIRAAYDDAQGITRQFNLNLLNRINGELGGDFKLDDYGHYQSYDPATGEVRSYIYSKKDQVVHLEANGEDYRFDRWEMMHTEISRKYSLDEIDELGKMGGFSKIGQYFDCKHYFSDTLFQVNS